MSSVEQADELRALSRFAFDELGSAPGGIGDVHRAVADRVFRHVGPRGRPVQAVHDAVADLSYGAVRAGFGLAGLAVDVALRARTVDGALSASPRGAAVVGAVQGLRGDALERDGSPLHAPMAVRIGGRPVPPDPAALAQAFPAATPRLVAFLHGLMETEHAWWLGAGASGGSYGDRLARDRRCTPVYLRYNSGRHVSENGRELAALLEALAAAWPVAVEEIDLIGHSMGGLVARSACHRATADGHVWVGSVRHVVSLGTPHLGAPLAQGAGVLSAALGALPETRPFAGLLRRRSAGIRDLRQGSLVDEDWQGRDADTLRAAACAEVPLLEGATHCFVSASVTRSRRHPVGRLVGDLLVLEGSAAGHSRRRRIGLRAQDGLHVGGATHFALLNHPRVYEQVRAWLSHSG
jgi:triacylglycerol esterase/lipase EstA (alpha/beta hydrolase family)